MKQRVARLFPLHLVTLALFTAALFYCGWQNWIVWADLPQNIILLNALRPKSFQFDWPSWSISVEFWINITLFYFLVAYRLRFVALVIAAVSLAMMQQWSDAWWYNSWMLRGFFGLFAGYLAYEFYLLVRGNIGAALLPLIVVAFVGLIWSAAYTSANSNLIFRACTIALIALLPCGPNPVSAFLSLEPLARFGDWSFSVYLIHVPLLMLARGKGYLGLQDEKIFQGTIMQLVVFCIVVIILSAFTYRYFELPAKRLTLRILRPRSLVASET